MSTRPASAGHCARPGKRPARSSMVAGGSYTVGLLVLGPLAEHASTAFAIIVAGAFSVVGAALYLPAIRRERAPSPTQVLATANPG
jgi:hypothetical protein